MEMVALFLFEVLHDGLVVVATVLEGGDKRDGLDATAKCHLFDAFHPFRNFDVGAGDVEAVLRIFGEVDSSAVAGEAFIVFLPAGGVEHLVVGAGGAGLAVERGLVVVHDGDVFVRSSYTFRHSASYKQGSLLPQSCRKQ